MIEVVMNYDGHINDIPSTYIERVNWSTVPHSDFETIKDEYLRHAPLYRVFENRKIDTISDDIVLDIIKKELADFNYKENNNGCDDLNLSDCLSKFLTREFVSNNKDALTKMFNRKKYLVNLQLLMASFGLFDFNTLDNKIIINNFMPEFFANMTQDEIYNLIKNTNVLYHLSMFNDLEYIPVLLNSKQLSELKLYDFDDLVVEYKSQYLSWDKWLDKYYANEIDFEYISEAYSAFIKQSSITEPSGFKTKGNYSC